MLSTFGQKVYGEQMVSFIESVITLPTCCCTPASAAAVGVARLLIALSYLWVLPGTLRVIFIYLTAYQHAFTSIFASFRKNQRGCALGTELVGDGWCTFRTSPNNICRLCCGHPRWYWAGARLLICAALPCRGGEV